MKDDPAVLGTLMQVPLTVTAELGRCTMRLSDVLSLATGAVVSLERPAGSPVDLFVNDELVGRGELIAIEECYGVRITELLRRRDAT